MLREVTTKDSAVSPAMTFAPMLQRKCACGTHGIPGAKCEECSKKNGMLRRSSASAGQPGRVPQVVGDVLGSPGQALDTTTRTFFEPRFGRDFVMGVTKANGIVPMREHIIADDISRGRLDTSVTIQSNDEVGELGRSLERMRASLKAAMIRLNRE